MICPKKYTFHVTFQTVIRKINKKRRVESVWRNEKKQSGNEMCLLLFLNWVKNSAITSIQNIHSNEMKMITSLRIGILMFVFLLNSESFFVGAFYCYYSYEWKSMSELVCVLSDKFEFYDEHVIIDQNWNVEILNAE